LSAVVADTALLEQTLNEIFRDQCSPSERQAAEALGWMPELWDTLAAGGLTSIGVAESSGGVGGGLADAVALLRVAGQHAVALPLAESGGVLGGWLVAAASLQLPDGPMSVAIPRRDDELQIRNGRVHGRLNRVPWGGQVAAVAALADSDQGLSAVLLEVGRASVASTGFNLAGEPRACLTFDGAAVDPQRMARVPEGVRDELLLRGALSRALLISGALESIADLTVRYGGERQQFGRPIGRFQAVAQRIAQLSCETEAAALAAKVAATRFEESGTGAGFEVAAAKITAARAAAAVSSHAHQIHGAIGMSQEYPLHQYTRRVLTWSQEWGAARYWAVRLGREVCDAGAERLWPRLVGSSSVRESATSAATVNAGKS
jgi:acyl-CoA dehydrogenase